MPNITPSNSDFILYTSQDGEVRVDVFVNDETVWLTQKAMQELFDRSKSTVSEHISNVFKEGELAENQVVRKFRTTDVKLLQNRSKQTSLGNYRKYSR